MKRFLIVFLVLGLLALSVGSASAQAQQTFQNGDIVSLNIQSHLKVAPFSTAGLLAQINGQALPIGTQFTILNGPVAKTGDVEFYWVQAVDVSFQLGSGYIEATKLRFVRAANTKAGDASIVLQSNDNVGDSGQQNAAATCAGETTLANQTGILQMAAGACNTFFTFSTPHAVSVTIPPHGFAHGWQGGEVWEWVNNSDDFLTVTTTSVDALRLFGINDLNGSAFNRDAEWKKLVDYLNANYTTWTWAEHRNQ